MKVKTLFKTVKKVCTNVTPFTQLLKSNQTKSMELSKQGVREYFTTLSDSYRAMYCWEYASDFKMAAEMVEKGGFSGLLIAPKIGNLSVNDSRLTSEYEDFNRFTIAVQKCKTLQAIELINVDLTHYLSILLKSLTVQKKLQSLSLIQCGIYDLHNCSLLNLLLSCPMKVLIIEHNQIDLFLSQQIRKALSLQSQLELLCLKNNSINNEAFQAIADGVIKSVNLKAVDLSQNLFNDESFESLLGLLSKERTCSVMSIEGIIIDDPEKVRELAIKWVNERKFVVLPNGSITMTLVEQAQLLENDKKLLPRVQRYMRKKVVTTSKRRTF